MAMQWRKSSVSTAVDDEACVEVAPLTSQEAASLTAQFHD
ncbi:DUF397 domain-containing protein [Actinoallomurus acanthiterrae]